MKKLLEICCYSAESAILAQKNGADRVELCDNFLEGGTTPSAGTIKYVREKIKIGLHPIIRPRGGDFCYNEYEFEVIIRDIRKARDMGADGIVTGILKPNGTYDLPRMEKVIKTAYPLRVTSHRAFDMCNDPHKAIRELIDIGVERILTSGQQNTAIEGIELLHELQLKFGAEIIIMPGSGVTAENIARLVSETGCTEFHASVKTFVQGKMQYFNKNLTMGNVIKDYNEFSYVSVDQRQIAEMRRVLSEK